MLASSGALASQSATRLAGGTDGSGDGDASCATVVNPGGQIKTPAVPLVGKDRCPIRAPVKC